MEAILQLKVVFILTFFCWLAANTPLIAAAIKSNGEWGLFWKIFTSSPNRYLYSLLFMPVLFAAVFAAWGLISHMLASSQIPENHFLENIWKFPAVFLLAISMASIITFWDFMTGNYNHADFSATYAQASFQSRDLILAEKQKNEDWKLADHEIENKIDIKEVANRINNGEKNISLARGFLEHVNNNRVKYVDNIMFHSNLVNVWFFVLSAWLTLYLLLVLSLTKSTIGIPHKDIYWMAKYLLMFSLYIIAIWTAFRGYEFREFREYGWVSGESMDLMLGILVVFVGSILLSICFEKEIQSIFSFMVFPFSVIFASFAAYSFVRQWYGSSMTINNFSILSFVWYTTVIILYVLFMKSKA